MPVERCRKSNVAGWRWGKKGHCYTGRGAKAKATAQGRAIKARSFISSAVDFFRSENYHCFFDLNSGPYKYMWITGFILIDWRSDLFWDSFSISFYKSGAYE